MCKMRFGHISTPENLEVYGKGHAVDYPQHWRAGIVFMSPHSGSIYSPDLVKRSKLSEHQLRRNEDIFVDHLFCSAVDAGAPFLRALFPRVLVDVNRSASELSPEWATKIDKDSDSQTTPRAEAGLGVIPTYLTESLPIYERMPALKDVKARLNKLYHPYHEALRSLIDQSMLRFGRALLVDCHSMPGFAPMGARRPDVILGDRFGSACHPDTLTQFRDLFLDLGYNVGVNYPYAGGYTTTHYGRPKEGVEAIQIEINRDLYVNPVTLSPKSGYVRLQNDIKAILTAIVDQAEPQDIAAQ